MADLLAQRPVRLLAASPDRRSVLLESVADATLQLPLLGHIGESEMHSPIAALLTGYLGHPHPILRVLPAGTAGATADILVVAEPVGIPDPHPASWIPIADPRLEGLGGAGAIGQHVARWLEELETGTVDPRRQRWEQPGFYDRARAWMRERLEVAGTPILAEPTVERVWAISAMLQAETTIGRAFLKACARVFDDEPAVTAALHRMGLGTVPEVVATDAAEGWLLMRDAGGPSVGDGPPDTWSQALGTLATIQRATREGLDGVALEDRGPEALGASLAALLESPFVAGFPDDIGPRFRAAAPRLLDACQRLATLAPGRTIVHGDFHPWNVLRTDDHLVVIDWSDVAMGHPFTDLATWLNRVNDPVARRPMLDAWLACWADAAPREELEEAARLALPVGALHQVESYRRIVESLEPGADPDLAGGGPAFARWALAWLDDGLGATVAR